MSYNQFSCSSADVITGITPGCDIQIGAPEKLFFTNVDFQFDTETLAKTESQWGIDIAAQDILPSPLVEEFDDNSEDDTYYVSPITSLATFIREGKADFTFRFKYDPCLDKRLRGLNGQQKRLIWVDASNNVVGTSPDDTVFKGIISGTLRVQKWKMSTGDNISFTEIRFAAESNYERSDQVAAYKADFNIKGLNGIQPATLTEVSSSATEIVVDVTTSCGGIAIEGLTDSDFVFYEGSTTTEEAITGAVESATIPGRYTLSGAAFVTGTLNLRDVVTLSGSYYKGTALAITI